MRDNPHAPCWILTLPAVSADTSGHTTRLPVKVTLSPGLALSTLLARRMTSMVRGRLPPGICTREGQQHGWRQLRRSSMGSMCSMDGTGVK